ncbi:MAG: hypothetical protein K9G67_06785 [Bacteroidales bacterium]|nr:hypothetical protein [Bacteroidales bacterium]MCF8345270.1 hypothetical protein [Bacteroidales bacterium]MCF8349604.1 hypothetical protein [Bacteroidales bacterium]MCF8376045.1 hypothetical protein [Bacteroidales bacterium]MCF8400422.1 hypothetical protein [Bacteroidales bacterium]
MHKSILGLFFFVAFGLSDCPGQHNNINFESLTNRDGLSQGTIFAILQDSRGFMWFGTKDGLNKYDGNRFVVYNYVFKNENSLSNNQVFCLAEDEDENLWIGTNGGGLNKLDLETEKITRIEKQNDSLFNIPGEIITSLLFVPPHTLWVGTLDKGTVLLNTKTGESRLFLHDETDQHSISGNTCRDIELGMNGHVYFGMDLSLFCEYDPKREMFFTYRPHSSMNKDIHMNIIMTLDRDQEGNIWMGDFGKGLYRFDPGTKSFTHYKTRELERPEIIGDFIRDILILDSLIYLASEGWGLGVFNIHTHKTIWYDSNKAGGSSLLTDGLLSLYEDKSGIVWIGTNGKGINLIAPHTNNFISFADEKRTQKTKDYMSVRGLLKQNDSLWVTGYGGIHLYPGKNTTSVKRHESTHIYCLEPDPDDPSFLWAGDEGGGLIKLHKDRFRLEYLPSTEKFEPGKIFGVAVFDLLMDEDFLWICTSTALNKLNRKTGGIEYFRHFKADPKSLNKGRVMSILKDHDGKYWVGTNIGGVGVFDGENNYFEKYVHEKSDTSGLSNNNITAIFEDSNHNIWICTHGGLNKYLPETGTFELYTEQDGLPSNVVYAALEDTKGYLWLSTNMGLSRFDPREEKFRNFDLNDGLQGNEFNTGAYHKAKDGELIFGGVNGFTRFYPGQIMNNPYKPPVVFTYLEIKGKNTTPNIPITNHDRIELNYDEAIFSIGFAALNYFKPQKNLYKYRIKGIERGSTEWIDLRNQNSIDFIGLDPGNYVLQLAAANNDGVWNMSGKSLQINIIPPFWQMWWFRILIMVMLIFSVIMLVHMRIKQVRKKQFTLQNLVDERTRELKLANQSKDKFFSIIGHDLKSPLSTIVSFSDLLNKEYDQLEDIEKREFVTAICKSSENLLKLTDNLLNWARAQSGRIKPETTLINISKITEENISLLKQQAGNKNIILENRIGHDCKVYADGDMVKTVIRNLLSNAVKFTPENGVVYITSEKIGDEMQVCVHDNGIGIHEDDLAGLFELGESVKKNGTNDEKGTGLGLILSKEFIILNKGRIWAEGIPGKGSSFCFTLPLSNK